MGFKCMVRRRGKGTGKEEGNGRSGSSFFSQPCVPTKKKGSVALLVCRLLLPNVFKERFSLGERKRQGKVQVFNYYGAGRWKRGKRQKKEKKKKKLDDVFISHDR